MCPWSVHLMVFEELFFDGIHVQLLQGVIRRKVLWASSEMETHKPPVGLVHLPCFFEHVPIREGGYVS